MRVGLGNLDTLKKHLLAKSLGASETRFDDVIRDIGLGVGGAIENFCNRKFGRVAGDQAVFQADRASFILPRYPVEVLTAVEMKSTDADGWVAQDLSLIQSTSLGSGVVYLAEQPDAGPYYSAIRFTYTGGYWFEDKEPDDEDFPSVMPATATALPSELRLAWLLQCRSVWQAIDKLGGDILTTGSSSQFVTGSLSGLEMIPMVKRMLEQYVLMQPI